MERRNEEDPDRALRRKMADPAFARQHVRTEIARKLYEAELKVYREVQREMGNAAAGLGIAPELLSHYEMTGQAAFLKFASPEQEAEFRRRVAAKSAEAQLKKE